MEICIPQAQSKFNHTIFTELVDKQRVKNLLKYELLDEYENENGFKINEYKQLKKYLKRIKYNKVNVIYQHSKKQHFGRVFAKQGLSLQMFRREIRHFLVYNTYDDIDIVNAFPNILFQLCKQNFNPTTYQHLKYYCENREKCLSMIKCDRAKSKQLYLMILHGGSIQSWRYKYNEPTVRVNINSFQDEIQKIGTKIHSLNNNIKTKWWGQTVSVVLQYYENIILECVYQYLKDNHYPVDNCVLCFDGIMLPKSDKNDTELLHNISTFILEKTGFNITFEYKKMIKPTFKLNEIAPKTTVDDIEIDTTDDTLALLFKHFFANNKFIFVNDNFYYFNDCFWVYDKNKYFISTHIAQQLYTKLDSIITKRINQKYTDALKKLKIELLRIKNDKKIQSIINRLKAHLCRSDIVLDNNPYIIVFDNGVYDLATFQFRQTKPNEYITNYFSTGYNYQEQDNVLMADFLNNYINKVFINSHNDKLVFFKLLSTCLLGKRFKKYIIANGSGDNAKTGFMRLLEKMLGQYAMKINVKDLCVGKKDTFSLNNLDRKRFVYCEEPDSKTDKFDGNFIKDLTGSDKANFRKIHSAKVEVIIHFLLIICCNKKPPINAFDNATKQRTIDFPFKSTFTDTDINNVDRFEGNEYFDTDLFRDKYKLIMFHFLLSYLQLFYNDKQKIKLTSNLILRRDRYLLESDEFYCWFFDTYQVVDDNTDNNNTSICKTDNFPYITIKSLYREFKSSNYYTNMSKANKRSMTKTKFQEELLSRKDIKKLHRPRYQPTIDGKIKNITNCLVGIKEKDSNCMIDNDNSDTE